MHIAPSPPLSVCVRVPACVRAWRHAVDSAPRAAAAAAPADSAVCVLKGAPQRDLLQLACLPVLFISGLIILILSQRHPAATAWSHYYWREKRRHQSVAGDAELAPRCGGS